MPTLVDHREEARLAYVRYLESKFELGDDRYFDILDGREDDADFIAGYLTAVADSGDQ